MPWTSSGSSDEQHCPKMTYSAQKCRVCSGEILLSEEDLAVNAKGGKGQLLDEVGHGVRL